MADVFRETESSVRVCVNAAVSQVACLPERCSPQISRLFLPDLVLSDGVRQARSGDPLVLASASRMPVSKSVSIGGG